MLIDNWQQRSLISDRLNRIHKHIHYSSVRAHKGVLVILLAEIDLVRMQRPRHAYLLGATLCL